MVSVRIAESDAQIAACLPVMRELRPHIVADTFVARIREQQTSGYLLAYLEDEERVLSVAGFRIVDNLVSKRMLYVDDLVTLEAERSKGFGQLLFDWLVEHARERGCRFVELDSGVQRFHAHRFYLAKRMIISAHHFVLEL